MYIYTFLGFFFFFFGLFSFLYILGNFWISEFYYDLKKKNCIFKKKKFYG